MAIGCRMRGLGESTYYMNTLKPKMDALMDGIPYEMHHEVGERKLIVRLDDLGEDKKPEIESLMDSELPKSNRMEYDPLPLGYTKIEFLESTGMQYINTGLHVFYSWNVNVDVDVLESTSFHQVWGWRDGYGNQESLGYWLVTVSSGNTKSFMYDKQEKRIYKDPVTSGRESVKYVGSDATVYIGNDKLNFTKKTDYETTLTTGLFAGRRINNEKYCPTKCRIWSFNVSDNVGTSHAKYIPSLNPTGIPCMYDTVTRKPFYNVGTGDFIAGLTMKQAKKLSNLPATSGSLTISLPKEARLIQHNSEVETALNDAATKGWNISVQYREAGEEGEIYKKYDKCTTVDEVSAINPDYKNDLTDEGEWIYPLSNLTDVTRLFYQVKDTNFKKITIDLPSAKKADSFMAYSYIEEVNVHGPEITNCAGFAYGSRVKKVYLNVPNCKQFVDVFAGCGNLTDLDGDFSSANLMNCGVAQLNKKSILWLCGQMPWYTGTSHNAYGGIFAVGVHVDHKNDEEIMSAIAEVEAKNYVVTLNWRGTATASVSTTYGLRKQPIFAKLSEREDRRELFWGHYVTNWKENGFQEFSSIEEAEEYFNIKTEIVE